MDKLIRIYLLQNDPMRVNILQVLTFYDKPIKMTKAELDVFIVELQQIKAQMADLED